MQPIMQAYLDGFHCISVNVSKLHYQGECSSFWLRLKTQYISLNLVSCENHDDFITYTLECSSSVRLGENYEIVDERHFVVPLIARFVVKDPEFDRMYASPHSRLGAFYHPDSTSFFLWAPTATSVLIRIEIEGENESVHSLQRGNHGVYHCSLLGDYLHATYTYLVKLGTGINETCDPYGLASTINGEKSIVIDRERIRNRTRTTLPPLLHKQDAILYETHLRDYSSLHKEKEIAGTILGFNPEYFAFLGISHVQIMPLLDFGSVDENQPTRFYNWGYDPISFFSLEGSYFPATKNPTERIQMLQEMVETFHKSKIRICLDVVYNHCYDLEQSALNRVVPYYYFRYHKNGTLYQGSGCKNDLDTTQIMTRHLLLASSRYLTTTFNIDGLRFDLMGLIDRTTLLEIGTLIHAIKPDFLLYGEGWDLSSPLKDFEKSSLSNAKQLKDYSYFNDYFRDNVTAFVLGDKSKVPYVLDVMKGHHANDFSSSEQAINYVECHDGLTFADLVSLHGLDARKERQLLGISMIIFAQGIPFVSMGQEFMRSKKGHINSYLENDTINGIDWKSVHEQRDLIEAVQTLITIRKTHSSLFSLAESELTDSYTMEDSLLKAYLVHEELGLVIYWNISDQAHCLPPNIQQTILLYSSKKLNKKEEIQWISPYSFVIFELQKVRQ